MTKSILTYGDLSEFTRGYVDAIFFTEFHCDNPELEDKGFADFAPATLTRIVEDCAGFSMLHKKTLELAQDFWRYDHKREPYTLEQAGHDFWLTRNGHGAGFWDRGLGDIGKDLTALCGHLTKYPAIDVFLGDDGLVYFA